MYDFSTRVDRRGTTSAKWHMIDDELGAGHNDVIAMSVADMEFVPAPQIVQALVEAAQHDIFGYDYATDAYYDAVVQWFARRHHVTLDPDWLVLSDGVMPAIYTALRACTHPGDAIVIQRPVYYPFTDAAKRNGLTILNNALVFDKEQARYTMNLDELETLLAQPRCTAMLLCNPHNPVGRVWIADELRAVAQLCIKHHVTLLVDEIHADFSFPDHPVTLMGQLGDDIAQHCIEFTAPTKTFNIAGLLCSNVIIRDPQVRERFTIAADNVGGLTVSHFGLVACIAAYNEAESWLDELLPVIARNVEHVRVFANAHDGIELIEPEGTYLAWLDCRGLGFANAQALRDFMIEDARIYCDEGALFGPEGAGFERINLACPTPMLDEVLQRLDSALRNRSTKR